MRTNSGRRGAHEQQDVAEAIGASGAAALPLDRAALT
jgi:hypothetical protein